MVKTIARAFRWRDMLENGRHQTIREIAAAENINGSYVGRVLRPQEGIDRKENHDLALPTESDKLTDTQSNSTIMPMEVAWGKLGCPKNTGVYRLGEEVIRVKKIHIIVAQNDPSALFTVVAVRSSGQRTTEFILGHRIA